LTGLALAQVALLVAGCGTINPNIFATSLQRDTPNYEISGSVTRGFASRPKVAYVLGEGDNPDPGSFATRGTGAGITPQGIYTPTALVNIGTDSRFSIKFQTSKRYVLIRIFAWDDLNGNNVRDVNETLAGEYDLKKEDLRGWSFNAPDWNQFNFVFTR
jgi:hypothetical protein